MSPASVPFESFSPEELLGPLNEFEKKNAPSRLFIAGDRSLLERGARVSIVGSREASPRGLREARTLSEALGKRGIIVVSGLALGIDTTAHESVIAAGGRTIAILGNPLDQCSPARNRVLQQHMMREHLVISQFPSGSPIKPGNFPMRNRTMALIADATVIIEAGDKSGSLHQGWEALRLGRPLFVMQWILETSTLTWPRELERYGAQPLVVDHFDVLYEALPDRSSGRLSEIAF